MIGANTACNTQPPTFSMVNELESNSDHQTAIRSTDCFTSCFCARDIDSCNPDQAVPLQAQNKPITDTVAIYMGDENERSINTRSCSKVAAVTGLIKHAAAAAPPLLSLATLGVSAGTYGLGPTVPTIVTALFNTLSLSATTVNFARDCKSGFKQFENMDVRAHSKLLATTIAPSFLAGAQSGWAFNQSILGNIKDNQFIVDGVTKSTFHHWKDYVHGGLGLLGGVLNTLHSMNDSHKENLLKKVNNKLPDDFKISIDQLSAATAVLSAGGSAGYPMYEAKHTTQNSSFANCFREYYCAFDAAKRTGELFIYPAGDQSIQPQETVSIEMEPMNQTTLENSSEASENPGYSCEQKFEMAVNLLTAIALTARTADFATLPFTR